MAVYTDQPTAPIMYLRPTAASFDVPGSGLDGGVNGAGESISIETSGGGMVICTYDRCVLQADDPERHEVINWLGARLNGSYRFINVPIINDGIGPFPFIEGKRRPILSGVSHSDGSLFSDGSGYSQSTVYGEITEDAGLNAGIIKMRVYGAARPLRWSDWFSIYHPIKGWRAYRYWEVIERGEPATENVPIEYNREYLLTLFGEDMLDYLLTTVSGGLDYLLTSQLAVTEYYQRSYQDYTLAIAPPLREAVTAGTRVELARPMCVMKFPRGFTLPWQYEGNYQARPTLQFVEAF